MNLVLDDAEELALKEKSRKKLGTFFLSSFSVFALLLFFYTWDYWASKKMFDLLIAFLGRILLKGDNITLILKVSGPDDD